MDISVILSTYKRPEILTKTLESFSGLATNSLKWEVLVVDNAGDLNTKEIVNSFSYRLPLTYLVEKKPGKNNALNRAIKEAQGTLFVFTDDDVIADPNWLVETWGGINRWPEISLFGGRILPKFPPGKIPISTDYYFFKEVYTIADWKLEEGPCKSNMVWGPNMAVRAEIFHSGWSFNPDIGPNGANYIMGSETEFTSQLNTEGYKAVYLPKSLVYHQIRPEQLKRKWVYGRAFRNGRSIAIRERWNDKPMLFGIPRHQLGRIIKVSFKRLAFIFDKKRAMQTGISYWKIRGIIYQSRKELEKTMRIVHIPGYRDAYQRSLIEGLKSMGLNVKYGRMVEFFSVANITLLLMLVEHYNVDIIHLHWQDRFLVGNSRVTTILKSLLFISQLLIIKILGVKLVWTAHNLMDYETTYLSLDLHFTKIVVRQANAIIAHCEMAKREVEKRFNVDGNKIVVIPHGSFTSLFKNTVCQKAAREHLNLAPTDFIFLFIGGIRPYKGVLELIESFQKLDKENTILIIAGKSRFEELIKDIRQKAEASDNIQLVLQYIPNDEMQIYVNAANIVVLPYRYTLNPGTAFTAISFGKPIIAPHVGCIPEILDSSGSFFFDPSEQDGLLKALRRAEESKEKLREMGEHNLELAKKLDWQGISKSTYRVYKSCLNCK